MKMLFGFGQDLQDSHHDAGKSYNREHHYSAACWKARQAAQFRSISLYNASQSLHLRSPPTRIIE